MKKPVHPAFIVPSFYKWAPKGAHLFTPRGLVFLLLLQVGPFGAHLFTLFPSFFPPRGKGLENGKKLMKKPPRPFPPIAVGPHPLLFPPFSPVFFPFPPYAPGGGLERRWKNPFTGGGGKGMGRGWGPTARGGKGAHYVGGLRVQRGVSSCNEFLKLV